MNKCSRCYEPREPITLWDGEPLCQNCIEDDLYEWLSGVAYTVAHGNPWRPDELSEPDQVAFDELVQRGLIQLVSNHYEPTQQGFAELENNIEKRLLYPLVNADPAPSDGSATRALHLSDCPNLRNILICQREPFTVNPFVSVSLV